MTKKKAVDIEVGNIFGWENERRPMISIKGNQIIVHDDYFVKQKRPQRWWYIVSWYRVIKALWKMPFMGEL
jgi:hypothetical protein